MSRWVVLAVCALLLTGCSAVAREPDALELVRVLGVDGAEPVELTAVSAGNGRGIAAAKDFEEAKGRLPWSGVGKELSLTGVSYLVVGPDVDLESLIFSVLEEEELGAAITVWLAEEGAVEMLDACEDPTADLELLTLQGVAAPTVAQVAAILSGNETLCLPCLAADGGRLQKRGEILWAEVQSDYRGASCLLR